MVFALNSSNWLAATAEPRCSLERLARAIFEKHTEGVTFNPTTSGAEWWAQVRLGGGSRHEGIEYHWDVDEHLCDLPGGGGLHVHPHLSTVTYLTDVGAPTLILDAGSPVASTKAAIEALYGPIGSGALSYPRLGKTIVFDGAKLHGAVPCQGQGAPADTQRCTFLVNVWLGHRPHAVEPLPPSLAQSMSQQWRPHPQLGAFRTDLAPPPRLDADSTTVASAASAGSDDGVTGGSDSWLELAFGRNDKIHALRVLLPRVDTGPLGAASVSSGGGSSSYRLLFRSGSAALGPNTSGLRCDRSGAVKAKKKKREHEEVAKAALAAGGAKKESETKMKVAGKKAMKKDKEGRVAI